MDGIWLKAQKRIDDFEAMQQRLARQCDTILKLLGEELPQKYAALFRSRSLAVSRRLFKIFKALFLKFEKRWEVAKDNSTKISVYSLDILENRWLQLQPRLDNLVQTSFAISTATSTLHLTVQITPILLSALTILATAPMLNALLPEFLFNSTVLFFIMMGISAYAGYSKFKELETRAKLDGQIELQEAESKKHQSQLQQLEKRLNELEQIVVNPTKNATTYLPESQRQNTKRREQLPTSSPMQIRNNCRYRHLPTHRG